MATFYPPRPPGSIEGSELKVWKAFEKLDGEWTVFHSVPWQAPRRGREGDGEADFILLHPEHGMLVVEVKGGGIEVASGQWYSTDRVGRKHRIKDPFQQALDSKHALLRYLKACPGVDRVPPIGHLVAMPDGDLDTGIGMYPRAIVMDGGDLASAEGAVERTLRHWDQWGSTGIGSRNLKTIAGLLAPTITVRRKLRSAVAETEAELIVLTEQQRQLIHAMRRIRRCVIRGGAGTGKTLLAEEKARSMASAGARTLLLCFNQPLAQALGERTRDDPLVTATTFHGLCMRLGREHGELPQHPDLAWFDSTAAELLGEVASVLGEGQKYDALVIDEAQDFSDGWLTALQLILRDPDECPVTLFLDDHQEIYRTDLSTPSEWPVLELHQNCRNSLPIARMVASCFGDDPPVNGAPGVEPSFVDADDGSMVEVVCDVVHRLLADDGLLPDQVVVLANSRRVVDKLRSSAVGAAVFGDLDTRGIAAETIHRFKGLEAATVVLSLVGRPADEDGDPRTLAYVGASRAKGALVVVATPKWRRWFRDLRQRRG